MDTVTPSNSPSGSPFNAPAPLPMAAPMAAPVRAPSQGMAITSLVLGCCSVLFFVFYAIVPVLAIIFGGVSISQSKKAGVKSSGMAVAGLTLGIVFTAVFGLIILIAVSRN